MANIVAIVAQIRAAILGKDVRESIASSIEGINTEVVSTTSKEDSLEISQTALRTQFDEEVINMTLVDPSSAEIVAGRTSNVTSKSFGTMGHRVDDVDMQLADIVQYNVKSYLCDDGQYVQGDGTHDDTTGIQNALDNAKPYLYFPNGIYKVTGNGEACLYLTRNIDIIGSASRNSVIRADNIGVLTSVLKVVITENWGFLDVRNWRFKNMSMGPNVGGKHSLLIKDGFSLISSEIKNNNLSGNSANGGYGIYVDGQLSHSKISLNTLDSIYLKCYDSNLIEKNILFGKRCGITIDCGLGVYNNTIKENTIVNRDGSVHIINGSLIRIINNQCELAQGLGISESPVSAMVWIEGVDRDCLNIIIKENNFGGGTSLDYLIYIDKAYKAIIGENQFIATNIAEILFTINSRYCIMKQDNTVAATESNPRPRTVFKANVLDSGVGNFGVAKYGSTLNLQNSWTFGGAGDTYFYYKSEDGLIHFNTTFNAGVSAANTIICTIPVGARPYTFSSLPCVSGGFLHTDGNGDLKITTIPSNTGVVPMSFLTRDME